MGCCRAHILERVCPLLDLPRVDDGVVSLRDFSIVVSGYGAEFQFQLDEHTCKNRPRDNEDLGNL